MRHAKWIAFIAAAIVVCPASSFAGGPGVLGGLTRASFAADGWSSTTGFEAGVFVTLGRFGRFEVQPGIEFVRKAPELRIGDGIATIASKVILDYIELPLLLRVNVLRGSRLTPVVFLGGFGAYRTRARGRTGIGDASFEEDLNDIVASWDAGIIAGAGMQIRTGAVTWMVDLRYSHGLKDIGKDESTIDWKTRTLTALAGVSWSR